MNSQIERLEDSQVKLTLTISPDIFEEGMKHSYNKNKGKLNIPGFRKGKVPRKIIERQFGVEFFHDDAINFVFPDAFEAAILEHTLDVVSRPEVDIVEVSPEAGLVLSAVITIKPDIVLGQYKGLTYAKKDDTVSEEDLDKEISKEAEKNSRTIPITDRAVLDGDTVNIDFEGFVDDVAFEGGKGEDYSLVIGSHTFIDTFEEQLIGKNIGEDTEVLVTFPENYGKEDLQGKKALFKVIVKQITFKELPKIDDEFAQDISEFETIAEYKNSIREKMSESLKHTNEHAVEDELIKKAVENATVNLPEIMVETQLNQMVNELSQRLSSQGLNIEMYMQFMGQDVDSFREMQKPTARFNVLARLLLEAIAKEESLTASEEEIDKEIETVAANYSIEPAKMKELMREDDILGMTDDIKAQKALKLINDTAVCE